MTIRGRETQLAGAAAVELAVIDHGIGIAPDDLNLVFEEFRQLDARISREHGGTGLGLSLVRRFTELLHGTVKVTSTPGDGSSFLVTLPLRFNAGKESIGDSGPKGRRVRVVEDDSG